MAGSNLDDLTVAELTARLAQTKDELFTLRFQNATGQLTNHRRLGQTRRDIARIMGRLRELELASEIGRSVND